MIEEARDILASIGVLVVCLGISFLLHLGIKKVEALKQKEEESN